MSFRSAAQLGTNPTSALKRCVQAYATGNKRLGETLYPAAHQEINPVIKGVVRDTIGTETNCEHEDVIQTAQLKIWQQIAKGIEPEIRLVSYHTSISEWRRNGSGGIGDTRSLAPNQRAEPTLDNQPEHAPYEDDDTENIIDGVDAQAIVDRLASHDIVWGFVAAGLSYGFTQAEIARALGNNRSTVNRIITNIRIYLSEAA